MINISLAKLAMQCAGEAKRNTARIKAREASARFLTISRGGKAMKELYISLQDISKVWAYCTKLSN